MGVVVDAKQRRCVPRYNCSMAIERDQLLPPPLQEALALAVIDALPLQVGVRISHMAGRGVFHENGDGAAVLGE